MANEEPTNPGIAQKAKDLNAKADPWFDRALDWLKRSPFTPIIVVIIVLPAIWVLVKIILWFAGNVFA